MLKKTVYLVTLLLSFIGNAAYAQTHQADAIVGQNFFEFFGVEPDAFIDKNFYYEYALTSTIQLHYSFPDREETQIRGSLSYKDFGYTLFVFELDQNFRIKNVEAMERASIMKEQALFEIKHLQAAQVLATTFNLTVRQVSQQEIRALYKEIQQWELMVGGEIFTTMATPEETIDTEAIIQNLRQYVAAAPGVIESFVNDLHRARIAYFGERHKDENTQAEDDTTLFFADRILPVIDALYYNKLAYEGLPMPKDATLSFLYKILYQDGKARQSIKGFVNIATRSKASGVHLLDQVFSKSMQITGYSILPSEVPDLQKLKNPEFEKAKRINTNALLTVQEHIQTTPSSEKLALFGGASHNDTKPINAYFEGLYVGNEIEKLVGKDKYIAVDFVSLAHLYSDGPTSPFDHDGMLDQGVKLAYLSTHFSGISKQAAQQIEKPILAKVPAGHPNRPIAKYIFFLPFP
ncbi:MAG: hypothetical protein KDK51_00245 [Deltaproteobacteria bacterium]|nr:hypothetical protein [Deltaproteobacteria bacterium]